MDETDSKIIGFLKRNARTSYTKIGKDLGITEGAVRKRVQNLVKSGAIKRFTVDVEDPEKVRSLLLVKVNTKIPNPEVAKDIHAVDYVERVYEISGEYDLVVHTAAPTIDTMNHCVDEIRTVNGVKGTNTVLILKEWY